MSITNEIIELSDISYKLFSEKLIPNTNNILGLRSHFAKQIAKKYANTDTGCSFLASLPHKYHDENMVHAYMLGYLICEHTELKKRLIDFLPYVENWAVCDSLCACIKRFFKNKDTSLDFVLSLTKEIKPYYVRVGLVCLLDYYVEEKYIDILLDVCKRVKSDHFYVKMALAWLISVMLVKYYDHTITLFNGCLDAWVHNKAISKACDSFRISKEKKEFLKSLRIRGAK